jgi:hypothetical protein
LWAALIARICEVFLLLRPICAGQMRIIAFINYSADIRKIQEHIGPQTEPPRITPARGLRLWDQAHALVGEGVQSPCWTGTRLAKRPQTLSPISASVGERHHSGMTADPAGAAAQAQTG